MNPVRDPHLLLASDNAVQRLLQWSAESGGFVTARQVRASGLSRHGLRRLIGDGVLLALPGRAYRTSGVPLDWQGQVRLETARLGGWASHSTAARLWGFDGCPQSPVHITVLRRHKDRRLSRGIELHSTARDAPAQLCEKSGIRLTAPARTLLDLAATDIGVDELTDFLSHLLARRLTRVARIDAMLSASTRGIPGILRLRSVLNDVAGAEVESVLEGRMLRLVAEAALPAPVVQHEVRQGGRVIARVDLAWPEHRVALEVDGYRYHSGAAEFERDRRRSNLLELAGWRVLIATARRIAEDPAGVICEVAAQLGIVSRPRTGAGEPAAEGPHGVARAQPISRKRTASGSPDSRHPLKDSVRRPVPFNTRFVSCQDERSDYSDA